MTKYLGLVLALGLAGCGSDSVDGIAPDTPVAGAPTADVLPSTSAVAAAGAPMSDRSDMAFPVVAGAAPIPSGTGGNTAIVAATTVIVFVGAGGSAAVPTIPTGTGGVTVSTEDPTKLSTPTAGGSSATPSQSTSALVTVAGRAPIGPTPTPGAGGNLVRSSAVPATAAGGQVATTTANDTVIPCCWYANGGVNAGEFTVDFCRTIPRSYDCRTGNAP